MHGRRHGGMGGAQLPAGLPAARRRDPCQRFTAPGTRTARGCSPGRAGTRVWIMCRQIPPVQGAEPCTPGLERGFTSGGGASPLPPRREPAAAEGGPAFCQPDRHGRLRGRLHAVRVISSPSGRLSRLRGPGAAGAGWPWVKALPSAIPCVREPPARFTPALLTEHLFMRCPEASLRPPGNPGAGISIVNSRAVPGELFKPRSAR